MFYANFLAFKAEKQNDWEVVLLVNLTFLRYHWMLRFYNMNEVVE